MKQLTWLIFILYLFITGCSTERPIYVISSSPHLQLPLKASKFFGFFDKNGINLQLDSVENSDSLLRFLNFSKYSVVLTDLKTSRKLEKLSSKWQQICTIALKRNKEKPIIGEKEKFVLLMRDSLLKRHKDAVKLVEGWNYGVDLLKDPAVVKLLSAKEVPYRFFHCGK